MRANMKGQISIDYYVSLAIFIFFVVYFLFQVTNEIPKFVGQMEQQRIRVETYQMSELLVNDAGMPGNWNSVPQSQIVRIGLSEQSVNRTNVVSTSKIAALNTLCSSGGQEFVRSKFGTDLQFSIFVVDATDGSIEAACIGPDTNATTGVPIKRSFSVTTKRIVAFSDGRYGELTFQAWR